MREGNQVFGGKEDMILCPNPCCAVVLRRIPGLHQAGEPYLLSDQDGSFMVCMRCGMQVRWQDEEPPANYDLGDGTAIA